MLHCLRLLHARLLFVCRWFIKDLNIDLLLQVRLMNAEGLKDTKMLLGLRETNSDTPISHPWGQVYAKLKRNRPKCRNSAGTKIQIRVKASSMSPPKSKYRTRTEAEWSICSSTAGKKLRLKLKKWHTQLKNLYQACWHYFWASEMGDYI